LRPITSIVASLSLVTLLQSAVVTNAQTSSSAETNSATTSAPAASVGVVTPSAPAPARKLPGKKAKGDDFSGDRDLNIFQVEPTVINERYYTSGKAERHQYVGHTLPAGAPIPDNEGPSQPETKSPAKSSIDQYNNKLDSQVIANLVALKESKAQSPSLKLKLKVSTMDDAFLATLKEMKIDVIASSKADGDMLIYAPAARVNDLGNLSQVLTVLIAQ